MKLPAGKPLPIDDPETPDIPITEHDPELKEDLECVVKRLTLLEDIVRIYFHRNTSL